MNLSDLQAELVARGFDYLSQARQTYFLNQAYLTDICDAEDWPFLETSATGTAPLTIADLGAIESVIDTTQEVKLRPVNRKTITDWNTDLSSPGTPEAFYITTGDTVQVYPANTTDSITVRYWKVPDELSSPTDEPVIPARYHYLIVEGAVKRAYEDDDEYQASQAADALFLRRLDAMRSALLHQQRDRPDSFIVVTDAEHAG